MHLNQSSIHLNNKKEIKKFKEIACERKKDKSHVVEKDLVNIQIERKIFFRFFF